jgi:ankyrin repeat protein
MAKLTSAQRALFVKVWNELGNIMAGAPAMENEALLALVIEYTTSFNGEDPILVDETTGSSLLDFAQTLERKDILDILQQNQIASQRTHSPVTQKQLTPSEMLEQGLRTRDRQTLIDAINQGANFDNISDREIVSQAELYRTLLNETGSNLSEDYIAPNKISDVVFTRISKLTEKGAGADHLGSVRDLIQFAHQYMHEKKEIEEPNAASNQRFHDHMKAFMNGYIAQKDTMLSKPEHFENVIAYLNQVLDDPLKNKEHYEWLPLWLQPGQKLYKDLSVNNKDWIDMATKRLEDAFRLKLVQAVSAGDIEAITQLFNHPYGAHALTNIDVPIGDKTLLYIAAENGQLAVLKFLMSMNADPSVLSKNNRNLLHAALIKENNWPTIDYLLSLENSAAMINATSDEPDLGKKITPFQMAVGLGNIQNLRMIMQSKYAKELLLKSPDYIKKIIDRSLEGKHPNAWVFASLLYSTAQVLGDSNYNPNTLTSYRDFKEKQLELSVALVKAIFKYGDKIESIQELLDQGAPVNAYAQYTPSGLFTGWARSGMESAEYALMIAFQKGHYETAELLLQYGASPYIKNPMTGNTVLHAIMLSENPYKGMRALLKTGPDGRVLFDFTSSLNATNKMGESPLGLAIQRLIKDLKFDTFSYTTPKENSSSLNSIYLVVYHFVMENMVSEQEVRRQVQEGLQLDKNLTKEMEAEYLRIFDAVAMTTRIKTLSYYVKNVNAKKDVEQNLGLIGTMLDTIIKALIDANVLNINAENDHAKNVQVDAALHDAVKKSTDPQLKTMFVKFYQRIGNLANLADLQNSMGSNPTDVRQRAQPMPQQAAASAATANPIKYQQPQYIAPMGPSDMDILAKIYQAPTVIPKPVELNKPAPSGTVNVLLPSKNPAPSSISGPVAQNEPTVAELLGKIPSVPAHTPGGAAVGSKENVDDKDNEMNTKKKNKTRSDPLSS